MYRPSLGPTSETDESQHIPCNNDEKHLYPCRGPGFDAVKPRTLSPATSRFQPWRLQCNAKSDVEPSTPSPLLISSAMLPSTQAGCDLADALASHGVSRAHIDTTGQPQQPHPQTNTRTSAAKLLSCFVRPAAWRPDDPDESPSGRKPSHWLVSHLYAFVI